MTGDRPAEDATDCMTTPRTVPAPFSPVLIAGLALRPLPTAALQPAVDLAFGLLRRRHPRLFERLGAQAGIRFLIEPVDLPLRFLLVADPAAPALRVLGSGVATDAAATIRGPLAVLIDLLEGRLDGDALFFARELVIEGDTEAVVALRNAVDGAGIDLINDLLAPLGPLAAPAARLVRAARRVMATAAADVERLRAAAIQPALTRADRDAARIKTLETRLTELERRVTRAKAP